MRAAHYLLLVGLSGALWLLAEGTASAQQRFALIISGAPGGAKYADNYDRWRSTLASTLVQTLHFPEDRVVVLGESAAGAVRRASAENVREVLTSLRGRMGREDVLLLVLIGHGTFDGVDAKFNLVGPDLEAAEWRELLKAVPGRLVVINTFGGSFPFVERLSAPGRVVISATDSAAQKYETIFAEFFIESLSARASDLDKNGRISIWEAFVFASAHVRQWYEQRGRLSTERPVIDDDGDGVGKEAGAPGPDGALARRLYIDAAADETATTDTVRAELLKQRAALEAKVEELKATKDSMPPDVYERELERLLVELALISRQIRAKS